MVKPITFLKSENFFKKGVVLAIAMIVIAFYFPPNFALASQTKINAQEIERIKTALDIVNTFSNIGGAVINGEDFASVLNTAIKGGQISTDITYGLLVLSAVNEMEFMDLVLSQKYKTIQKEYFKSILNERTNLISHWKGIGFDLPKVLSGQITGPMAGLSLNTFEMTSKVVQILAAFENLKKGKQYDGLWYYFDFRRNGDAHKDAWETVEIQMGWAAVEGWSFSYKKASDKKTSQLENQFAELWNKWGSYATPWGISEEYKEQAKEEMRNMLTAAAEKERLAKLKKATEPSWLNNQIEELKTFAAAIKNSIQSVASNIYDLNPFGAGPVVNLPEVAQENKNNAQDNMSGVRLHSLEPGEGGLAEAEVIEEIIEARLPARQTEPPPTEEEITGVQPLLDDEISEMATSTIIDHATTTEKIATTTEEITEEKEEVVVEEEVIEAEPPLDEPGLCEKIAGELPKRYRVLINEVAWMGSSQSPNDEWIELRNIWGIPVNLEGWQLQDKDQKIKIIFEENDIIPAGGYYLLERTDDDSLPGAKADKIYTGALNNANEALYLFDNNCRLEDEVLANPDWPGGDSYAKKPMERMDTLYWYTNASAAGTPRAENSTPPAALTHPSASPAPAPPAPKPSYPKILINEIQIENKDSQKDDFVELYNPNDESIDLTDWYIQRKTASSSEFSTYAPNSLFEGKIILERGYFLIVNASSSFATSADAITTNPLTKNNTLALKNPDGKIADKVGWGDESQDFETSPAANPPADKSIGRATADTDNNQENFEVQNPTPKSKNESALENAENNSNGSSTNDGGKDTEDGSLLVVINEIAWMGTKANSADEWIELYNNTTSTIDLTGWSIAKDDEEWITFSTSSIHAQEYYLLERSDDQTVSDIAADQFFTYGLNNSGHKLELKDAQDNLIDLVDASAEWFAGNNDTKQTMERINSASSSDASNWANNNQISRNGLDAENNTINGTPSRENSVSKPLTEVRGTRIFFNDFTLMKLGSPYVWKGELVVEQGAKLTVEPGVVVKFNHSSPQVHAQIKIKGEMEAIGTEEQKIVFTSFQEGNYWDGLYFENSDSVMENVIVSFGGKLHQSGTYGFAPYTYGAIYAEGGKVNIKNSLIENSQTFGAWLKNSSVIIDGTAFIKNPGIITRPTALFIDGGEVVVQNSSFEDNDVGVFAEGYSAPAVVGNSFNGNQTPIKIGSLLSNISGNTAQNNGVNGISLWGFGFIEETSQITWKKTNLPYVVDYSLTIAAEKRLEVESGVIVKFKTKGRINVEGSLAAIGSPNDKIIFTSFSDDEYGGDTNNNGSTSSPLAGQWRTIRFSSSSAESILEHTIIRYGGSRIEGGDAPKRDGAIKVENNSLFIKDSVIENNLVGIELVNSDFDKKSKNISVKNNNVGIYIEGDCPDFSKVAFEQNTEHDVFPEYCQEQ